MFLKGGFFYLICNETDGRTAVTSISLHFSQPCIQTVKRSLSIKLHKKYVIIDDQVVV